MPMADEGDWDARELVVHECERLEVLWPHVLKLPLL